MPKETPAIILNHRYEKAKDARAKGMSYAGYVGYVARPDALPEIPGSFAGYLNQPYKSDGLFNHVSLIFDDAQVKQYANLFAEAQNKDIPLHRIVVSFREDFLEQKGLQIKSNPVDLTYLKNSIITSVPSLLRGMNLEMEDVWWVAAIHLDTDNIHCHLAFVDKEKVSRRSEQISLEALERAKSIIHSRFADNVPARMMSQVMQTELRPAFMQVVHDLDLSKTTALQQLVTLDLSRMRGYGDYRMEVHRPLFRQAVDELIEIVPELKELNEKYMKYLEAFRLESISTYGGDQDIRIQQRLEETYYTPLANILFKSLRSLPPPNSEQMKQISQSGQSSRYRTHRSTSHPIDAELMYLVSSAATAYKFKMQQLIREWQYQNYRDIMATTDRALQERSPH